MTTPSLSLVYREMRTPFALLVLCFAAWGTAANMTDPLVKVFSQIFNMSLLQSALVQFAYYGAYFCLAIPAALINWRFGYRTGVLIGLGLATSGALLFYPASQLMTFHAFLTALFILAGGLSILETSANPYVMSMGPEENATRRLNLAQAFNPVGTNLGVLLATTLILPRLHPADAAARATMPVEELTQIQQHELSAVMFPYVGMACVLFVIWLALAVLPAKQSASAKIPSPARKKAGLAARELWHNRHYRYGVVAQFFNVAAQTCIWTFTISYAIEAVGISEATAGWYLQLSMVVFLVSRFIMTWIMSRIQPSLLLVIMAASGATLCIYISLFPGMAAIAALVSLSACLSLMFPTIYGVALKDLGEYTQFGAAGLVMAILGGALIPLLQARIIDTHGAPLSFLVPAGCFAIVLAYALFDLKNQRA